jgi:hypothetical protein
MSRIFLIKMICTFFFSSQRQRTAPSQPACSGGSGSQPASLLSGGGRQPASLPALPRERAVTNRRGEKQRGKKVISACQISEKKKKREKIYQMAHVYSPNFTMSTL